MALAIDGTAKATGAGVSSVHCTLTTTQANDVIVVLVQVTNASAVVTISDVAGLTWNLRALNADSGGTGHLIAEFWAVAPSALVADVITASFTGPATNVSLQAFGVSGSPSPSTPWDVNPALPIVTAVGSGASMSVHNIATTNSDDFVLSVFGTSDSPTITLPETTILLGTPPPSFGSQYVLEASPVSGLTQSASLSAGTTWLAIGDALAGGAPPPLTATASATPDAGPLPLLAGFLGTAVGGIPPYTYAWTFGDGGTSTDQNPTNEYTTAGPFLATLTVTDSVATTATTSLLVFPGNSPVLTFSEPGTVAGGNLSLGPFTVTPYGSIFVFAIGNWTSSPLTKLLVTDNYARTYTGGIVGVAHSSPEGGGTSWTGTWWRYGPVDPTELGPTHVVISNPAGGPIQGIVLVVGDPANNSESVWDPTAQAYGQENAASTGPTTYELDGAQGQDNELLLAAGVAGALAIVQTLPTAASEAPATDLDARSYDQGSGFFWSIVESWLTGSTPASDGYSYLVDFSSLDAGVLNGAAAVGIMAAVAPLSVVAEGTPFSGAAPLTVAFTSTPARGVQPYTYAWDFGEGLPSTDQNPTHVFFGTGAFDVVVTVTDAQGTVVPVHVPIVVLGPSSSPAVPYRWHPNILVINAPPSRVYSSVP